MFPTRPLKPGDIPERCHPLALAEEAFHRSVWVEEEQLWCKEPGGQHRALGADDASHYLQGIFAYFLKDAPVIMVPECSLEELLQRGEPSLEHMTYRLIKTPCNHIDWHVDVSDEGHGVLVTEVEELNISSDDMWYMRQTRHRLGEHKVEQLLDTISRLLAIASKVSDDPEDEYLSELFQQDASYFEEHGCYRPDF